MTEQSSKMSETERVEQGQKLRTSKATLWSFILAVISFLSIIGPFVIIRFVSRLWYNLLALGFIFSFLISYPGSLLLSIIGIFTIKRHRDELKGMRLAVAGIALNGILAAIIVTVGLTFVRPAVRRMVCGMNMSGIGKALLIYANDFDGKYPTADKWCDLLIKYVEVTPEEFRCKGAPEGRCNYAMNKNVEKLGINAHPDMVLLFESKPGWNQSGGPEIVTFENHKGKGCNVLFNSLHVEFVKPEQISKLKWKEK
jgi:hypothetical protein